MFVLVPLAVISTVLSTSIREGILKKTKVFLVVTSGSIVYTIIYVLMEYMKETENFFQCDLLWINHIAPSSINAPYNFSKFNSLDTEARLIELFNSPSTGQIWLTLGNTLCNFTTSADSFILFTK